MFGCPNLAVHIPLAGALTGKKLNYYLGFRSFLLSKNTFCGIGLQFLFAFIFSGRDKMTNMISFLFSGFVGLKSFVCNRLCFCNYSFTFFNE